MVQIILSGIESVFSVQLLYCELFEFFLKFCFREWLVVALCVFVFKFDFYFFCFCFDDLKTYSLVFADKFCGKVSARRFAISFSSVIFRLWVRCFVGVFLFLPVIFRTICHTFFWLCVTIYFGNVISPWISFGVFNDFSGFSFAVFMSFLVLGLF